MTRLAPTARLANWRSRWGGIAPLLLAEFIVWLGFGGLLPVLPLYFVDQGVDLATLGLVIAAWPAARLIGEPIFGWLADRTARVPLMVVGLLLAGIFTALPLAITGPVAFIVLRAAVGLATAIYDPAARGYVTDATPPERRGEAFGLYGAAQMGGLLLGPAIGAIGADRLGGIGFVFVFGGLAAAIAAIPIARLGRESGPRTHPAPALDATEFPPDSPSISRRAAAAVAADRGSAADPGAPSRLLNRGLIAALVINAGGNFAAGTYDVIWSLFLQGLGAGLGLIGLTFAMFGLPILVLSPMAGRLVDRRGSFAFIVLGSVLPAIVGFLYTRLSDPNLAIPLILVEATGFAFLNPALYRVVAANSPPGRSSTAQGIFGAAGTVGFIVASLIAGVLAAQNILYPFYVFSGVLIGSLVIGLLIGGPQLRQGAAAADLERSPVRGDTSGG
ncbi:MAG: MFS transporter [Candidatus Limnocylindrales bacterium]|nr:MFS transporter [Candidatus Limnocylindrales bacterium]